MKKSYAFLLIIPFILVSPSAGEAQEKVRAYLNAGYVTSLGTCEECEKADAGGSVRVGIFTKGRFGFYAGYLWFKEFHSDYIDYDDEGSGFLAGVDLRFLTTGQVEWYGKLGLFREKYTSTYAGRTEDETSIKPDFGLLLNIKHVNVYLGWQPSDPHHLNLGIGITG